MWPNLQQLRRSRCRHVLLRARHPLHISSAAHHKPASVSSARHQWRRHGDGPSPPKIRLHLDGRPAGELPLIEETARPGSSAFSFTRTFAKPGAHLVSVAIEPDPKRDALPPDDIAHTVVEVVPTVRVLIVTGDPSPESPASSAAFLRNALAPPGDPQPAFSATVVASSALATATLRGRDAPRVVILHDVSRLSPTQLDALAAFADSGGGVLVVPGSRVDLRWYADAFFRNGSGPLPALLGEPVGDEVSPWRVEPSALDNLLFGVFGSGKAEGLLAARFPRAWPLTLPDRNAPGRPLGLLSRGPARLPLFVEAPRGAGRVIVSSIPLDAAGGDLVTLPAFVPLVREVAYRLAAVGASGDIAPGRPMALPLAAHHSPADYRLTPPGGPTMPLAADGTAGHPCRISERDGARSLIVADTLAPGVYRIDGPDGTAYRVVAADPREGDLTPASAEDLASLKDRVGLSPLADIRDLFRDEQTREQRQDLAWLLLFLVLCLLCGELWLTRRHALRR